MEQSYVNTGPGAGVLADWRRGIWDLKQHNLPAHDQLTRQIQNEGNT